MMHPDISKSEFNQRQLNLLSQMLDNSIAIVPAATELTRSRDTEFPFRQNSDFQYLTGFPEPDAYLLLEKTSAGECSTLLCRAKDKLAEIWHGRRIGVERAVEDFSFDYAFELTELEQQLTDRINGKTVLYWAQGESTTTDNLITQVLNDLRNKPKQGGQAPVHFMDIRPLLHEMRLFKSEQEVAVMAAAAELSAQAHVRAMKFSAKQLASNNRLYEYQLEAELHHEFAMNGARYPAYGTIVGAGDNACILHYTENQSQINANELVLIDAGCELKGYAADITRTFPAGGKFSLEQKAIYQIVLDAQLAVLDALEHASQHSLKTLTDISIQVITEGLVAVGILNGDVKELISNNAHRAYYMHGLSHWLGLDVHDVGDYKLNGDDRLLQPGMMFTVEPGIYIDDESDCDPKWHGIGVRIEDNILITQAGYRNLTSSVPKSIDEIETIMHVN